MIPYEFGMTVPGQLVQLAEAYVDNNEIGSGRHPNLSKMFIVIHPDNKAKVKFKNLYRTIEENDSSDFYLHTFNEE